MTLHFRARLSASTTEAARLAGIAMHPQTRAAIVCAKAELQRLALESQTASAEALRGMLARLQATEARIQMVGDTLERFGRNAPLFPGPHPIHH
jgi:hypothetical protein